jgi:prevent-host-death family protein
LYNLCYYDYGGDDAMKTIGTVELRRDTADILASARYEGERYLVTRAGKPFAVLLGISDWEVLQSELATLQEQTDPEALAALRRAKEDIAAGWIKPHEEVFARFREKAEANA